MRKIVLIASILLLFSTSVVMTLVSQVVAQGTIYIKSDGSVDPSTAPIRRDGNVYTFTDNIYDEIVVQRDNIVVDGASHILQGTGSGTGIYLSPHRRNVTIQNMQIRYFDRGIYLRDSSSNNIYRNIITNNEDGVYVYRSSENIFYHNSFIDNTEQVYVPHSENVWDDGYPSGGNYWSDYTGVDQYGGPDQDEVGSDGIGDTEYFIDYMNRDRYPLMSDLVPPTISIISPENKTYAVTTVPLTFTASEPTFWIGYSLDGQANVTVSGNTTILGLSDGVHTITVYANDTDGNIGSSDTIYFAIDTVAPKIEIVSPENKTYTTDSVSLVFTVNEPTSWIGYSLDGQANSTIAGNATLMGLSDGMHSVMVYASDMVGNMGSSEKVYFAVDTTLPGITILSPENKTYDTNFVPLSFTVDEQVSWMAYSLGGQANVTITGNVTLTLPDGLHYVVVYANDTAGNMGASSTVYFSVDSVGPSILLISPINTTYASTSVPLRFVMYEIASWMGYSLDGLMNVTVGGNTTLVDLSDGVHTITVYAADTAGNMGSSQTVYFTIDTMASNIEILSPGNKTYATADVPLVFTVSEATSWIGYSLDGQANSTIAGNATLMGLSDGMHSVMVYASDMVGNMGSSEKVYFAVDTTLPGITILSPENKTYADNDVPLSFTVDEQVSWMAYSLDGQANVTITGDITLSGLSKGSHSLTVYVKDMAGNAGASKVVHFAVEIQQPEPSELFIVAVIAILAGAGFALTGYMAYDLFGRPRNELRPRTKGTFCSSLFPQ